MAKIINVLEKTSQAGKKYYIITAEGLEHQILSYNPLKMGEDVDPANLELNDKGDTYKFKGGTNGKTWQDRKSGSSYVRNDELIVSQVAFKAVIDLATHDKLDLFDEKGQFRENLVISLCTGMGRAMMKTAEAIKPAANPAKT